MKEIEENLWKLQDKEYREFQELIPNVDPESIIRVRTNCCVYTRSSC